VIAHRGDDQGRVRITDEEVRLLQGLIHDHCGLTAGVNDGFFLERRLSSRLRELGLTRFTDYYHVLRFDAEGEDELDDFVERITTHETYFFREQFQLDGFCDRVLPALVDRLSARRSLAFWSAGCSTGEEAYTIAMLVREQRAFDEWSIRVIGTDLSRKVLAAARAGVYGPSSFRTTKPALRRRYFEPVPDGSRVCEPIRKLCTFRQLNLVREADYAAVGPVDAIFCRNVLMYLSGAARNQIIESFYDRLAPGGYLLLGHSESLLSTATRFEHVHLEKDLVYRRPLV